MSLNREDRGLRLTLVRHGRAEPQAAGQADFDRALDRRGLAEVAGMAQRCLELGVVPQELRASAALRTQQTAAAFARVFELPVDRVRLERGLYLAAAAALLESVHATAADVRHLMLVGHNPGLAELAQLLAPRVRLEGFATAATCTMRFDGADWRGLRAGAAADVRYESPEQLSAP
jgi:phosphohistidine phosphatase